MERNYKILLRDSTALLLIDIQEKILNVMLSKDKLIGNCIKLIKGFKVLNLPVFFTEQYPKGLGSTTHFLQKELEGLSAIQKTSFSCYGAGNLFQRLKDNNIKQVVIAGIESHVCVQQTVLDLLANNFQVDVCADAVSSRKETDLNIALERMRSNNAEITSVESVLFELLQESRTEEFKKISAIIK
ncbi:MAG: hydrolase [Ignavibacteriaceae bacterium]